MCVDVASGGVGEGDPLDSRTLLGGFAGCQGSVTGSQRINASLHLPEQGRRLLSGLGKSYAISGLASAPKSSFS